MHSVLIIGCGAIAGGYDQARADESPPLTHAGAYTRDTRFKIAACIDTDQTNRVSFAKKWSVERSAIDLDGLAAEPGAFDVISICSPTHHHSIHVTQALTMRPKLIFCEKPIAGSLSDAERLVDLCAEAGVALAINYTRRWAPDLVALASELQAGDWGRVLSASGYYTKGIVHNGGHLIDLLQMLLGELSFVAAGFPIFDHWDDDPTVPALLTSGSGTSVQLIPGDARAFSLFEFELVTEKGTIAMCDGGRRIETRAIIQSGTFDGHRELAQLENAPGKYDHAMSEAINNIAENLETGATLASTGANALPAQRLCEEIRAASLQLWNEKAPT